MSQTEFSVGVEEEYQLVDPQTGALRSRARDVLEGDWTEELYAEVQETMLEVGTRICGSAAGVADELRRLRLYVGSAAAAQDLAFVAAGVHPFSRWEGQAFTRTDRYERVMERFGRVLRTEHVFGMHVHVAVPEGIDRAALLGPLRWSLPLMLALAASSPVYEGEDTSYASYRTILIARLPLSGIPPRLESEAEFERLMRHLLDSGAMEDLSSVYWSLRPHPRYPTLEFRTTDVCPRLEDAVALCALARALVAEAVEEGAREPRTGLAGSADDVLLATNEWQAARYGLDATLIAPESGSGSVTARDAVRRLVDRLGPRAERLGDGDALRRVERLLDGEGAAERIRTRFRAGSDPAELVRWLAAESQVGVGLDRRAEQREA